MTKVGNEWKFVKLNAEEIESAISEVREFNKRAFKMALEDAQEIFDEVTSGIRPLNFEDRTQAEFEIAKLLFECLSVKLFSIMARKLDEKRSSL